MTILLIFAFLAGIATVLSPCIIPILPTLLAGSAGKGRLHPIGIVIGVICSFVFFILTFRLLIHLTGVSPNVLRYVAIIVVCLFGLALIFPALGEAFARATQPLANLGAKLQGQRSDKPSGFISGLILGCALGLLWTPCAGPILATIITLTATNQVTFDVLLLTFLYSLGAAVPMFLIIYGGKRLLDSSRFFSKHAEGIRKGFGVLMIASAFVLASNADSYFTQLAVKYFPFVLVDDNALVNQELQKLKQGDQKPLFEKPTDVAVHPKVAQDLPELGPAPNFAGIADWINSQPLTMEDLRGKVVLIDFWTYSCINCIRTFPYLIDWYDKYKDKGFVIVGVHSPEFEFEKEEKNVLDATKRFGIAYPVAMDNNFDTWKAYQNHFWPAHYLIDQKGIVRDIHFGEGKYLETENNIRLLLGETPITGEKEEKPSHNVLTPETYLGYGRAGKYTSENTLKEDQTTDYTFTTPVPPDHVGLKGKWKVGKESINAEGDNSELSLNFIAGKVFLVLSGRSPTPITVSLDGTPLPKEYYTSDMNPQGEILVNEDRKYDIIDLKEQYGRHTITLSIPKGISAYAFTFGD